MSLYQYTWAFYYSTNEESALLYFLIFFFIYSDDVQIMVLQNGKLFKNQLFGFDIKLFN